MTCMAGGTVMLLDLKLMRLATVEVGDNSTDYITFIYSSFYGTHIQCFGIS
jgi:hypothetical protein